VNNDLIKRLLSSIFMLPISFFIIIKGGYFFISFLIICLIISLIEWKKMLINKVIKNFGIFFICLSFYSAYNLRFVDDSASLYNFLFILLICIFTDIGGFVFGKVLKGPKLSIISPNKTYAGVIGGFFFSVVFLYLILSFVSFFDNYNLIFNLKTIIHIIFLSLISQIGDLIISYFKRLSKIKDTGRLIPGHGGILDRIDGMIFVFPFALILNLYL
jgi:phosphatidate cytidylyltransferase